MDPFPFNIYLISEPQVEHHFKQFHPGYTEILGNTQTFRLDQVKKSEVLLLPGTFFNCSEPDSYLRFGFGRRNMPEALNRLDNHLEKLFW